MKEKKLFNIDPRTRQLLEIICHAEGITASDFLRLTVRAWRYLTVFDDRFRDSTDFDKAKMAAQKASEDLSAIKSVD